MQPQDKDIDSLNKFWHWADHERPDRDLFDAKATAGGPLTEEAQEAMQQAVEVVSLRAPDCLHPSGEVLRPAIKAVSFAIMYAWKLMRENPMIVDALNKQEPKNTLTPISGYLDPFCGEDITITYPDGTKRYGSLSKGGNGVYDFNEYTGKAKDIIAKKRAAASKDPADHIQDAAGYTAYNNVHIPGNFVEAAVQRKEAQIKGLSHHYSGQTVNLKPVTIAPVIGEMGVRKDGLVAFPDAANMFTGEPAGDYAKCESECNRILNLLGVSDVRVTVDIVDGRVVFYHRIYTGITYTLNYAPTVSSKSVEAAVSIVRKGALAEDRSRAF